MTFQVECWGRSSENGLANGERVGGMEEKMKKSILHIILLAVVLVVAGCSDGGVGMPAADGVSEAGHEAPVSGPDCLFGACDEETDAGEETIELPVESISKDVPETKPVKLQENGDLGECSLSKERCKKTLKATGGSGKYLWSIETQTPDVTLDEDDGKSRATVLIEHKEVGTVSFHVTVRDAEDESNGDERTYSVTITEDIVIEAHACDDGGIEQEIEKDDEGRDVIPWGKALCLEVSGGSDKAYTWNVKCSTGDSDDTPCDVFNTTPQGGVDKILQVDLKNGRNVVNEIQNVVFTITNSVGDTRDISFTSLLFQRDPCDVDASVKTADGLNPSNYHTSFGKSFSFTYSLGEGSDATKAKWEGEWTGIQLFCSLIPFNLIPYVKVNFSVEDDHAVYAGSFDENLFVHMPFECYGDSRSMTFGGTVTPDGCNKKIELPPVTLRVSNPTGMKDNIDGYDYKTTLVMEIKRVNGGQLKQSNLGYLRIGLLNDDETVYYGWEERRDFELDTVGIDEDEEDNNLKNIKDIGDYTLWKGDDARKAQGDKLEACNARDDVRSFTNLLIRSDPDTRLRMKVVSYIIETKYWCGTTERPSITRQVYDLDSWRLPIKWVPKGDNGCKLRDGSGVTS